MARSIAQSLISIKLEVPVSFRSELRREWVPGDGVAVLQGIDDAVTGRRNYQRVFQARQSEWKPLTEEYRRWKVRKGFSPDVWKMSGATLKALTTPVKIGLTGGRNPWSRVVKVTCNSRGRVEATWEIKRPAARGHFAGNNAERPFIDGVEPDVYAAANDALKDQVATILRRAGFEVSRL